MRLCINIGPGSTATGPLGERVLRSSSDYVDHEVYANAAHTQVWGSWGISVSSPYPSGSAAGVQQDVTPGFNRFWHLHLHNLCAHFGRAGQQASRQLHMDGFRADCAVSPAVRRYSLPHDRRFHRWRSNDPDGNTQRELHRVHHSSQFRFDDHHQHQHQFNWHVDRALHKLDPIQYRLECRLGIWRHRHQSQNDQRRKYRQLLIISQQCSYQCLGPDHRDRYAIRHWNR